MSSINRRTQHLQVAGVRVGVDMNIFGLLDSGGQDGMSLEELQVQTGAAPTLLGKYKRLGL